MTLPIPSSSTPAKKPKSKDEKVAHGVELAGKTVASGVGTAFGASKLRDAYCDDLKSRQGKRKGQRTFDRHVDAGERKAARVVGPKVAAKGASLARTGRPGFRPLVVAVGAGSVATGASRYQSLEHYVRAKREQIGKSEPRRAPGGNPLRIPANPPKHATQAYAGKRRKLSLGDKVKIQAMIHQPKIHRALEGIVDIYKSERVDARATLATPRPEESTVSKSAFGVDGVEIEKALTGTPGDKRNTKYAAATYGGAALGSAVRGRLGAAAGAAAGAATYRVHRTSESGAKQIQASRRRAVQRGEERVRAKAIREADVSKSASGGSAFGVEGVEVSKGAHSAPGLAFKAGQAARSVTDAAKTTPGKVALATAGTGAVAGAAAAAKKKLTPANNEDD